MQHDRAVHPDQPAAGSLAASPSRRTYIVNVSAMEGSFGRGYKGPGHPHTNMAKAALNMLTRTSARELLETDGILMTSVDTGWITDERPHTTRQRLADEGFHAPLDLVRRRRPRLRPDRAGRGRRGPPRRLPQGLRPHQLVSRGVLATSGRAFGPWRDGRGRGVCCSGHRRCPGGCSAASGGGGRRLMHPEPPGCDGKKRPRDRLRTGRRRPR